MKTPTSSLFVLLMSTLALASTTNNQITEIKGNSNSVSNSASGNHIKASANVNAARRSLASLFRRDPEFEFAMGILGRLDFSSQENLLLQLLTGFSGRAKCKSCGPNGRSNRGRNSRRNCSSGDREGSSLQGTIHDKAWIHRKEICSQIQLKGDGWRK